MSWIPLHFTTAGATPRTVWGGVVLGWKSATDKTAFENCIKVVVKQLTGVADLRIPTLTFQTKEGYDMFTASFPQGQDFDLLMALAKARQPLLEGVAADVSSIDDKTADATPDVPPPTPPA